MSVLFITLLALLGAENADSLRTTDIEEVVVVSTPKEHQRLRQQPLSSTSFAQRDMHERGIMGVKALSAQVPNLFIPDYGSHLTTSVYVRGVGSRTGSPAVALYVDGVPQVSAASYDFNFSDVDRVDVLRGPQSTLYGRNSVGGVIRVFTKNPMNYQGTDVTLDASHVANSFSPSKSGRGRERLRLTHYHRLSGQFAFSASLFADRDGGYFRNQGRNRRIVDDQTDLGGRMRFVLKPSQTLHLDLTVSHEWLEQGGYPYEYRGVVGTPTTPEPATQVGEIAYNNRSGYRRHLTNAGLMAEKTWSDVVMTSTTGFQYLSDRMDLDQDFTTTNLYTLMQGQRATSLSEELILKPSPRRSEQGRYAWLCGLSAFRQWLETQGPVTFHDEGLAWLNGLVNQQGNSHLPTITSHDEAGNEEYKMNFVFDNQILGSELLFPGTYKTPATNVALFHQGSLKRLFGLEALTLTAGLRLDYEHFAMDYDARYAFIQRYGLGGRLTYPDGRVREGMTLVPAYDYDVEDGLAGSLSKDYLQLLPRLSLQWQLPTSAWVAPSSNVYVTVSRGYRSGGYNVQMFSDLLQTRMQSAIMHNVASATVPVVDAVTMIPDDVRQTVREMLIGMGTQQPTDVQAATWFMPEQSWNYELGAHLNLKDGILQADVAAFWASRRDQQVSKMTEGGRVTVNSGRSRSIGVEVAAHVRPTDDLTLDAAWGYTSARFRDAGRSTYVPFVPRHTFAVGATQRWRLPLTAWLSAVSLHADYCAAGRIYWTEDNNACQPFAGRMNARLTLQRRQAQLALYASNILSTRYQTFYFETMQRAFAQYTRPIELGIQVQLHF